MRTFYGMELATPLMLGTAQYPLLPRPLRNAFRESGAQGGNRLVAARERQRSGPASHSGS